MYSLESDNFKPRVREEFGMGDGEKKQQRERKKERVREGGVRKERLW